MKNETSDSRKTFFFFVHSFVYEQKPSSSIIRFDLDIVFRVYESISAPRPATGSHTRGKHALFGNAQLDNVEVQSQVETVDRGDRRLVSARTGRGTVSFCSAAETSRDSRRDSRRTAARSNRTRRPSRGFSFEPTAEPSVPDSSSQFGLTSRLESNARA